MPHKRLGRPPSPPETARSERVVTFLTQRELEQLQQLAIDQDMALSATIHQLIAEQLKK
jgi:hypothetical protein